MTFGPSRISERKLALKTLMGLVLVCLVSGCAVIGSGTRSGDPFRDSADRQITVIIENRVSEPIRVEAVGAGIREDVGFIGARSTRRVGVPWSRTQNIRFQLSPQAGRRSTTNDVNVGPGERLFLVIQAPLDRSYVQR